MGSTGSSAPHGNGKTTDANSYQDDTEQELTPLVALNHTHSAPRPLADASSTSTCGLPASASSCLGLWSEVAPARSESDLAMALPEPAGMWPTGMACARGSSRRISPLSTWQMMELLLDGCWHFMCLNVSSHQPTEHLANDGATT